ncbi:hypothetical protein [Pseudomonas phage Itty13]|uniref:Uncharacterized protein n=1 Tax=Pseudomonas phage Itty13 TaxID=2805750 RepID=A0A889IQM3_9CAUD|nr:hypothetical protein PQC19_gp15 [Pseudomonas phage Itty13]QRE00591.1 hypothetical protein [Pseudomonas phage Itty13]
MNLHPINAAELNGSNEIWSWYGSSTVAVASDAESIRGASLSGDASIQVQTTGEPSVLLTPPFYAANIMLDSDAEAIYGRSGSGASIIQIGSDADGTRWVLGESASDIVFLADGDAQVVAPAAASFDIIFETVIEERVTPGIFGEGASQIIIATGAEGVPGRAVRLEPFGARIELATRAAPHLVINSPAGDSTIALSAVGDARFGRKVYLEPADALIELFSRGDDSAMQRYVYAEGAATIVLLAGALQAGIPPIPTEYVPAPRSRTIIVQRDPRGLIVARETRSI